MPSSFSKAGIVESAELQSWYESGCSAKEGPAEFCRPVSDTVALSGVDERKRTPSRMVPADCVPVLISPAADVVAFRFDWFTGEVKDYIRTWADSGQIDLWAGSLRGAILRDVSYSDLDVEASAHLVWAAGSEMITTEKGAELLAESKDNHVTLALQLEKIPSRCAKYPTIGLARADLATLEAFSPALKDDWATYHLTLSKVHRALGNTSAEGAALLATLRCNRTTDVRAHNFWPRLRELGVIAAGSWEDRATRLESFAEQSVGFFLDEARAARKAGNATLALEFYYRALYGVWSPRNRPLDAARELVALADECGATPLANVVRIRELPPAAKS